jgi:hypothetical protein
MEVVNTEQELKLDIENIKEYIKGFNTLKDFYRDPNYTKIYAWINNRRNRTGDQTLWLTNFLSELIEKDKKQTTENLKEKFPDFNFENVTYSRDTRSHQIIEGIICERTDKEGVVHGELNNIRLDALTQNSCKKCFSESIRDNYPQDLDFKIQNFLSTVPKDSPLIFSKNADGEISKEDFYLVPRFEGSTQNYLMVKNIKCANHENPTNLYPNGARAVYKRYLEFACDNKKKSKGESTMIDSLSGYTVEENKKIGEYSIKGRGKRNRLKADAYFVKEDGTVVIAEFDGRQHFGPNEKHGGEEGFASTVLNDKAKNKYCKENGIKLIRISYTDEKNISDELATALSMNPMKDIYLSTTYPQKGWNEPNLITVPIEIIESKSKKEYIITESQLKVIVEIKSAFIEKLRRRFNEKTMRDYIYHVETEFPNPCEKFDNEFEYADTIINQAVDDFLFQDELWEYFHSGDWPVVKITDMMVTMCKEWFGDGLLGFHQTTCQDEFDDEDFDMMNEEYEIASDKVIVRLFKLFNEYKKKAKTKKELLNIIMEYLPLFGIPKVYAIYMLELYLLNYREDGDYSGLNKDNFIDPRNKSGKKTANYQAGDYTKAQLPFQGSNLEGRWTKDRNGVKYYVVKSYGWYPVYIYKEGKWYENFDRYSSSTGKQMNNARPYTYNNEIDTKVYLMSKYEMGLLESGFSHEDVMKKKKESFRDVKPSPKISTTKSSYGEVPNTSIKFKISSVEETDDVNIVNVDIYDVLKTRAGVQIDTPENYLKGEIPNVTPEKVEKEIETKLRQNFRQYLGPKLGGQDEELVTFRFNHLKK